MINLNLHFVFWGSWVHCSTISNFLTFPVICFGRQWIQFFEPSFVFVYAVITIFSHFDIKENKSKSHIDFCSGIQLVEGFFKLLVDNLGILLWHLKANPYISHSPSQYSQESAGKHSTPPWLSLHLPLPPPQSCSNLPPYHLPSIVSPNVLFSDVVGESSNSETFFRKTIKSLIAWKLIDMLLGHVIIQFLLVVSTKITHRTRNGSSPATFAMSSRIGSSILLTTVLAFHFLIPDERGHLKKSEDLTFTKIKEKYMVPTKLGDLKCLKSF